MGNSCCCCASKKEDHNLGAPTQKRRCTDIPCCMVFVAFWIGMIAIAAYCLLKGDAVRLLHGYDDYGNVCGLDNTLPQHMSLNLSNKFANLNMVDRPYVFFTNFWDPFHSYVICVKKCPDSELISMNQVSDFANRTGSLLCDYSVQLSDYPAVKTQNVSCAVMAAVAPSQAPAGCYGPCPAFQVPVERSFLHRCLPSVAVIAKAAQQAVQKLTKFLQRYQFFYQFGMDFVVVKWELLGCAGIALGLSLLMVFLMRFVIKFMVWFVVVLAALAAIGVTVALWVVYARLQMGIDPQQQHQLPIVSISVNAKSAFLAYSIIATVFTVILLLIILVMRKRLALAVQLFREAGKCLETMPSLLVQPLWPYLWNMGVIAYAVAVFVILHSVSFPVEEQDASGKRTVVRYYEFGFVTYLWWYHLFGILWMLVFTSAMQQLIIAGAVAKWYFTRDKKSLSCTVLTSTRRTLVYHLGSAAFGSFLIVLVKLPRYILMWLSKKCKASENECAKFTLKCCICCLWCLEKCLKFINRNAYIVIAISSTDFCHARVKAFKTLAENMLRVAAINSVGDFVLFLGKVLVTAANVGIAIALFERYNADKPDGEKHLYLLPLAVVGALTYAVADGFLSVYEMLVDTLLLCFCEDEAINDGSPEKPYFMSQSLRDFVNSSSQTINNLSAKAAEAPAGAAAKAKPEAGDAESSKVLLASQAAEAPLRGNKVI